MSHIIEISDLDAPELTPYLRLTEAQLRSRRNPDNAMFIAESPKVIGHALDMGYTPVSLLMERKHLDGQGQELISRCDDTPVYTADSDVLETLTGYKLTRGILCAMRRPVLPESEVLCYNLSRIAVLENIVDPTNVGAIFRSAAALGMDAVLVTPSCCDPLHRRAVRVSMGTVFQVPWTYIVDDACQWPEEGLNRIRSMGFKTAAMALSDESVSVDDEDLMSENKLAIILGTEGDGISSEVIAKCDYSVCIPMQHGVDSLNVAAASAVAFWQLRVR